MAHWLLKTEPSAYSWADLARDKKTAWSGIINPAALKHIRTMHKGDAAIIYHTGDERAAVGIAEIVSEPHKDPEQDDEKLVVVDVKAKKQLARPVTLAQIKADKAFAGWDLLRIGRLSVVPAPEAMWNRLLALAGEKQKEVDMSEDHPHPVPSEPLGDDHVHKEADDAEEIYYSGSPMLRGTPGKVLAYELIGLLFIAGPILLWIFMKQLEIPFWVYALSFLIGAIILYIPILQARSVRYRVTNYRIDYERGLFSKDIDTLELWHVEDIKFHQSLLNRILNVGNIEIISHDDANPALYLRGVPNPRALYEQLKQRVIAVKRQRGVIKMDPG